MDQIFTAGNAHGKHFSLREGRVLACREELGRIDHLSQWPL